MKHGLMGEYDIAQNACAASLMSIGHAYRLISHGYLDAMLAGGVDTVVGTPTLFCLD